MIAPTIDTGGIGRWTQTYSRAVSRQDIERYLAATNSPIAVPLAAPPVFAYLIAQDAVTDAMLSVTGDFPRNRMLNGEMRFTFDRPCLPGQIYTSTARPRRVENRGKGTVLHVEARIQDKEGRPVGTVVQTAYLLGLQLPRPLGEPLPGESTDPPGGPERTYVRHIDADQPGRFTVATGEDNPIHRDAASAQAVGLPGIIVHGTCVLAMVVDGLATELGRTPTDIRGLRARFTAPVTPDQDLHTMVQMIGHNRYTFHTLAESGSSVLERGLVTFGLGNEDLS